MDKVQKYNSFNTNTPSSESYRNYIVSGLVDIWRTYEKFVDSPYYSELELCGGVVMVSFFNYVPWQVMHFLQCSTHF
jgi:hypothetical protein